MCTQMSRSQLREKSHSTPSYVLPWYKWTSWWPTSAPTGTTGWPWTGFNLVLFLSVFKVTSQLTVIQSLGAVQRCSRRCWVSVVHADYTSHKGSQTHKPKWQKVHLKPSQRHQTQKPKDLSRNSSTVNIVPCINMINMHELSSYPVT